MTLLRPVSAGALLLSVLFLPIPEPAGAQSRIRAEVDTTLVTVGDRIQLSISVDHPAGSIVNWPDSIDLSPFEVLGAQALPTETEGDRARSIAVISLAAFELGELEIPSFDLSVTGSDGGVDVLSTDRFGIEVVSVGADESGDIREIRGPLSIAMSGVVIAMWGLLMLMLGAALYALVRRFLPKTADEGPATPSAPARPPHEVALEAFDRLEASPMLERGQVKEYHIEASNIVRHYLEARFDVTALEMTTWEIVDGLRARDCTDEFRGELRAFLDRCDLVKFAKVRPDAAKALATLRDGRSLVEKTVEPPMADDVADMPETIDTAEVPG